MGAKVIRTWPSSSNPNVKYELRQGADGVIYCTCKAYAFSRAKPKTCKHMEQWADAVANGASVFAGGIKT